MFKKMYVLLAPSISSATFKLAFNFCLMVFEHSGPKITANGMELRWRSASDCWSSLNIITLRLSPATSVSISHFLFISQSLFRSPLCKQCRLFYSINSAVCKTVFYTLKLISLLYILFSSRDYIVYMHNQVSLQLIQIHWKCDEPAYNGWMELALYKNGLQQFLLKSTQAHKSMCS